MFEDKSELIDRAIAAHNEGNLRLAIEFLERAEISDPIAVHRFDSDPLDSIALCLRGTCLTELEQYSEATEVFEQLIALDPGHAGGRSAYAQLHADLENMPRAIDEMREAIRIAPTSPRYTMLGVWLADLNPAQSIVCYRLALDIDPINDEAMYNLAVQIIEDEPAEAEALLNRAIEIDPANHAAFRELAHLLRSRGEFERAEQQLLHSLTLPDRHAWALLYLAEIYSTTNRIVEAEEAYLKAVDAAPLWSFPAHQIAQFYDAQDRIDDARKFHDRAYALEPDDSFNAIGYADHFRRTGDLVLARQWIERALELDPAEMRARRLFEQLNN